MTTSNIHSNTRTMYPLYYRRYSPYYPFKKYDTPKLCEELTNDEKTIETLRKQRKEWELYLDDREKRREADYMIGMVYIGIAFASLGLHVVSRK